MNRRSFLHAAAVVGAPWVCVPGVAVQAKPAGTGESAEVAPQPESARRIQKAIRAAMSMERRDWEQGILAQAMLEAGEREYAILLTKAAIVQQTPDGRMAVVVSGGPTDPSMGGVAYNKAAEWTADAQIREAVERLLDWIRTKAPRNAAGILYHVLGAREMWSDGLNCAPPFLAAMGFYDEALKQIDGYRERLWNPEKKLLAHIWDDERGKFKDGNFWGGGNGWAAAGLARTIRCLPSDRSKDIERLAEFCREIGRQLIQAQLEARPSRNEQLRRSSQESRRVGKDFVVGPIEVAGVGQAAGEEIEVRQNHLSNCHQRFLPVHGLHVAGSRLGPERRSPKMPEKSPRRRQTTG